MTNQPADPVPEDLEVKIVHISDLHVGHQFNNDKWKDFRTLCINLKPDVLVVTGD